MAAIPHWSTFSAGPAAATSTTWVDAASLTFAAADQVVGKTYAVFWKSAIELASQTLWGQLQVLEGATARASVTSEGKEIASPLDRVSHSGFFFFQPASTPVATTFKIQVSSNGAVNHSAYNSSLIIIELPANHVRAETTAEQTLANSASFTDIANSSMSVAGEYLFLASCENRSANTSGVEFGISIDAAAPAAAGWSSVKDSNNYASLVLAHKGTATAAAKLQFRQTVGTATAGRVRNIRFLALKTSDFRNIWHSALAADNSGTEGTYQTAVTMTQTVSAGDHLLIGTMYGMMTTTSTVSGYAQITSGGSTVEEHIHETSNVSTKSGAVPAGSVSHIETLSAGSRTWTLQRRAETAGAGNNYTLYPSSSISVIDLEAASGGTSGPVARADETEAAFALGASRPVGLATGTNAALARPSVFVRAVGAASESDTAIVRGSARPAGLGSETDVALALTAGTASAPVGLASETDTAHALSARQIRATGLTSEVGIAFPRSAVQVRATGVAAETDAALVLPGRQVRSTGLASEVDAAFARGAGRPAGRSSETGTALALIASASKLVGIAAEIDSAVSLASLPTVGVSAELEEALALMRYAAWDHVPGASGSWDPANDADGAWANVAAAGGIWAAAADQGGSWTPVPPATGGWS